MSTKTAQSATPQTDALQEAFGRRLEKERNALIVRLNNQRSHIRAFAKCLDGLLSPAERAKIPGAGMDGARDAGNVRRIAEFLRAELAVARCQMTQGEDLKDAETQFEAALNDIKGLNEKHGLQLAAISTASFQNTEMTVKDRINRESPYWTAAYGDMCAAIDREMTLRARVDEAEKQTRHAWERHAEKDRAYGESIERIEVLKRECESAEAAKREIETIGDVIGCNHTEGLATCVRITLGQTESERDEAGKRAAQLRCQVEELSLLLRRTARALPPKSELRSRAVQFLKSIGQAGIVLREMHQTIDEAEKECAK